ncbi:MAG: cupredoxin domain-containing protein, partial [Gemmatimonadaceae bacterium]
IGIDNFRFTPPALTVPVGTRVTWVNDDDVPHLIASTGGRFKSSTVLDTGQRYALMFAKAGTYSYFCSLHPMMQGTIVVS